jgi:hypothetical protein
MAQNEFEGEEFKFPDEVDEPKAEEQECGRGRVFF